MPPSEWHLMETFNRITPTNDSQSQELMDCFRKCLHCLVNIIIIIIIIIIDLFSQAIQDVDEFVSSSDLEKCSTPSLACQWILCSEWVPSEWESKHKNITIIHTTPVHQLTSWENKYWNKSIIKMLFTANRCFRLKYESIIHNIGL